MKIAIYPGSFNPIHEGHIDIIRQTRMIFDKVIIARGINPNKEYSYKNLKFQSLIFNDYLWNKCIKYNYIDNNIQGKIFQGLFRDFIIDLKSSPEAIIKGLRNGQDFEYEKNQQYWNEDLGISIPTFYIISNRNLCHISSSAIRGLEKFKGD